MFDNDTRGQRLIAELKEWTSLRDKQLEHNVRADGSVRVIGFQRVSGRRLMYIANQFGKNASFSLDTSDNRYIEIDFQDDIAWEPNPTQAGNNSDLMETIKSYMGSAATIAKYTDRGSTNVVVIRAVSPIQVTHKFVRTVLNCANVIDMSITRTYCNIMIARKSNMVGGLAHIGATSGFQFNRHPHRNAAGKSRRRRRRGAPVLLCG